MKFSPVIGIMGTTLLVCSMHCTVGPRIKDDVALSTSAGNGQKISLHLERGDFWIHQAKLGLMKVRVAPQMAVWVEDSSGAVATLYVTQAFAKQNWRFAKLDPNLCERPMCMPYWLNRLKANNIKGPTKVNPLPDAITAATPTGSFTLTSTLPEKFVAGKIYVEINKAFDNNNAWPATKDMSGANGQPPLVYEASINLADSTLSSWSLAISGISGDKGDDPKLYPLDNRLTTALNMVKSITVSRL
jgi:hypothetical protein